MSVWILTALIFCLRIIDVSLGTLRTISVVRGRVRASMIFGFAEVLVWSLAITQVFVGQAPTPVLMGYAAGYAAGNAVGIFLERRFAKRRVIFMILTSSPAQVATAIDALGGDFSINVNKKSLYVKGCRSFSGRILSCVREIDADATVTLQDELT